VLLQAVQAERQACIPRQRVHATTPSAGVGGTMADLLGQQPVVIDNGSGVIKAGFAGGEKPRVIFSAAVGRAKLTRVMIGGALESSDDVFVGKKVSSSACRPCTLRCSAKQAILGSQYHNQPEGVHCTITGAPAPPQTPQPPLTPHAHATRLYLRRRRRQMEEHRGAMRISYPMSHGMVESWGDVERVWRHVYDRDNLAAPPEEHPVLLTEAPLNPYKNRQRCAEVCARLRLCQQVVC
jgi:Actin